MKKMSSGEKRALRSLAAAEESGDDALPVSNGYDSRQYAKSEGLAPVTFASTHAPKERGWVTIVTERKDLDGRARPAKVLMARLTGEGHVAAGRLAWADSMSQSSLWGMP